MTRARKRTAAGSPRPILLPVSALAAVIAGITVLATLTDPHIYLPVMGAVLLSQIAVVIVSIRQRASDYDIRKVKRMVLPRASVEGTWGRDDRERKLTALRQAKGRAANGFADGPVAVLEQASTDPAFAPSVREFAAEALKEVTRHRAPVNASRSEEHFDVVIVSNLNLPGGTTSSNANEIQMLAAGGKTVGLFHHPLYIANSDRPVNAKITELVDGESVRFIDPGAHVSCDLLLMRFPPFAMRMREDLPVIRAEQKMLVINQSPMTYYDHITGRKRIWEVRTVRENLTDWIGKHRWVAAGPLVRQVLIDHHGDEIEGIDLSSDFWYPTLDLARFEKRSSNAPQRPLRIGRHSRDHLSKWPELAADLRKCYPEGPEFEIRVLGGAKSVERLLGHLPSNWTTLPFDSVSVPDFLTGLDFYVYYPGSTLLEAFGRAPVEAMAAGIPTVLPPVFQPVFGDGAVYADPSEVKDTLMALADNPQQYVMQQKQGLEAVHQRFSFEAHRDRFRAVGIDL